jgi:hypothetical protein
LVGGKSVSLAEIGTHQGIKEQMSFLQQVQRLGSMTALSGF